MTGSAPISEVAADRAAAVRELLQARGHDRYTEVSVPDHPNGEPCVIWADDDEQGRLRRLRDAFRPGQTSPYPAELTRPKARPDQVS
jgi:hypothetical protein